MNAPRRACVEGHALLKRVAVAVLSICAFTAAAVGQDAYERPVTTAPQAEDIGGGYQVPAVQHTPPRGFGMHVLDVGLLVAGMATIVWVVRRGRRRWVATTVTLASLAYFGFYRQGCVCPVGATQNVAVSLVEPTYAVPLFVLLFFLLPLVAALLFGRVFCGGVCPLGAIQDLVLLRPMQTPRSFDLWAGILKYVYLGGAIWFAVLPAVDRDFIICRFDPFVGIFRLNATAWILGFGVGLLALGTVVGRPYCRYLCPYGGLLAVVSRFAIWPVRITPDEELDCGLCVDSCPFGAIRDLRAEPSKCFACARCFAHCPRQQLAWGELELVELEDLVTSAKQDADTGSDA